MLGELTGQQIEDVLHADAIDRVGCHVAGRTYIVPITYADDGEYLYGHSAAGMKAQMMRANPSVRFEVEHVDDLANRRSVIAWSSFEELQGDTATVGVRTLRDTLTPLMANSTRAARAHRADTAGKEAVLYRHTPGREDRAFREALRRLSWRMPDKRPKRR